MRTVGFDKLCQLMGTAAPYSILISPGRKTQELVAKGFLRERDEGGWVITPHGLRQLAWEMENGHIAKALERLKAEAAARRSKAA